MKPPVEPLTPIPTDERDSYFEFRFALETDDVEVAGIHVRVSDVLQLDPLAYGEARRELLGALAQQIEDNCDEKSVRRLRRLTGLISVGGVVPFVGAGVSRGAGYPDWAGFLRSLCHSPEEEAQAEEFLRKGAYELLASSIRQRLGGNGFDEALDVFEADHPPSELAFLIASTFRDGVITTNFDTVMERAFDQVDERITTVQGSGNWSGWASEGYSEPRPLLKLHGHFRRTINRVLLQEEYDSAYAQGGTVRRDLSHLLRSRCLLFIGSSLGPDRTMALAHELQNAEPEGSLPRHYAFLPEPDSGRVQREAFLNERGIFPIWYPNDDGNHVVLTDMLWVLKSEIEMAGP